MSNDANDNTAGNNDVTAVAPDPLLLANAFLERYARYRATRPELLDPDRNTSLDTFLPPGYMPLFKLLPTLLPNSGKDAAIIGGMVCMPLQDLNVLYQVRDNAKVCGVSHDEELLIELVALVFDRIFQDQLVPELIKRMLAQLQVPVLKAVLLDRSLIVQPTHPVRQLFDLIAETACGRSDVDDMNSDYCLMIRNVVEEIGMKFDENFADFSAAARKMYGFNQKTWSRESARHESATKLLQVREQREIVSAQLALHLRDALAGIELNQQVRDFLLSPWHQVLLEDHLANHAPVTLSTLQNAVIDLVWSLQPKVGLLERQRLAHMLPHLLKVLRQGLNSIDWPKDRQEAFFALLMELHTSAMNAEAKDARLELTFKQFQSRMLNLPSNLEPDTLRPNFSTESLDLSPSQLNAVLRENGIRLLVAYPPGKEKSGSALGLSRVEAGSVATQIDLGHWIEFIQDNQPRLLKLRWVSPLRTLLLFTDGAGEYSVLFTPEVLRAHLENHTASVLSKLGLTARVLASLEASMASP
jgi:hypothetical protein